VYRTKFKEKRQKARGDSMGGDSMDKICIVKLRKKMTNPATLGEECGQGNRAGEERILPGSSVPAAENRGMSGVHDRNGMTDREKDVADRTVSLMLTPEQMRVLQSNPNLLSFFNGAAAKGFAVAKQRDETIVFKFAFEPVPPVRLLKMEEVVHMLRISKGYLTKIIRQGELKSYKLGRLRRIMFDDVLSYLEGSQEFTKKRQRALNSKISQNGIV
jgi:excisionase family DNA binding protein